MTADRIDSLPSWRAGRAALATDLRADLQGELERNDLHLRLLAERYPNGETVTFRDGQGYGLSLALAFLEGTCWSFLDDRSKARRAEEADTLGERVQVALDNEQRRTHHSRYDAPAWMIRQRAEAAQNRAEWQTRRRDQDRPGRTSLAARPQPRQPVVREDREGVGDRGR